MKKLVLIIIVVTTYSDIAFCQESDSIITTTEQSLEWLSKLEGTQELDVQLTMLKHRVLLDTNLFVRSFGDRVFISTDTSKIKADCRLMIVVNGELFYFDNKTESEKVEEFVRYLTVSDIESLEVPNSKNVSAIYGSRGICGLVSLRTTKQRTVKRMKRIFK